LLATDFEAALLEAMIVEKSPAPAAALGAGRRRAHQPAYQRAGFVTIFIYHFAIVNSRAGRNPRVVGSMYSYEYVVGAAHGVLRC
jgi:hypothetical protein